MSALAADDAELALRTAIIVLRDRPAH